MNFFNIPHIFVVFPAGAGGNFVSGLIAKLDAEDLSDLNITPFGSSHTVSTHKRKGGDSISFGSKPEESFRFKSIEEKEKFYLNKIKEEYTTDKRIITWTHDFDNLHLYKKHFKNCKTLSISCPSVEEKLTSILMHVNKVFLADELHNTIPLDLWLRLKAGLKSSIKVRLEKLLQKKIDIDKIFNLRFTIYNDLIFYLSAVELLKYANLYEVLDLIKEEYEKNEYNSNIKEIVLNFSDTILPYRYLKNRNFNLLKSSISTVLDKELSIQETDFLKNSFEDYLSKQDWQLLNDPLTYFNSRKENAMSIIEDIKKDYL
jgi:hypothetical protein